MVVLVHDPSVGEHVVESGLDSSSRDEIDDLLEVLRVHVPKEVGDHGSRTAVDPILLGFEPVRYVAHDAERIVYLGIAESVSVVPFFRFAHLLRMAEVLQDPLHFGFGESEPFITHLREYITS